MKLIAKVLIFALVCHLALGDNSTNTTNSTAPKVLRYCVDTQYWNGTGCSPCPAGCGLCVVKGKSVSCITCLKDNQYLQITNDIGSCANCSDHCASCRGPTPHDCLQAAAGFTVNPITKTITECKKEHCQFCNADGSCGRCNYRYQLNGTGANSTCNQCAKEGCAECPAAVANCTKCMNGYQFVNGTCSKCSEGCESCPSGNCTLCAPGYDLVGGKCVTHTCTTGCAFCDEKQVCTKCLPTFWLNTTGNGTCVQCSDHCADCDSTGCKTCKTGTDESGFHYALNDRKCNKCNDLQCKQCDGNGTCQTCYEGYTKDDKNVCVKCATGCQTCTLSGGCTQCSPAYKTIGTGVNATCKAVTSCQAGEQLEASGNCTAGTIDNCEHGDAAAKTCVVCSTGYYPEANGCSPCPNGCTSCAKNATSGYVTCVHAWNGAGWSIYTNTSANAKADGTGYLCRAGCATCDKGANCTSCMPNLLFTESLVHKHSQFCLPYEHCPHPVDTASTHQVQCYTEEKNHTKEINQPAPGTTTSAGKLAMTFVVAIAAALFAL